MGPLISVIIPIYNTQKYLKQCIKSVLNQTYFNIEILLIDDGSTDSSGEICDRYAERDSRVRVIHQENGGVSKARNTGLDLANGEWIMFVDSDDSVELDMIEELLRLACEEKADLVIGGYYGYGIKGTVRWNQIPNGVLKLSGRESLENIDSMVPWGLVWGKLYRAELWKNERFPINQLYEDSWTSPHILNQANLIATYPRAIYHYYERKGSIMHSKVTTKQVRDRLNLYCHLTYFYETIGLKSKFREQMMHYIIFYNKHKTMKLEKEYQELYESYIRKCIFVCGSIKDRLRALKAILLN